MRGVELREAVCHVSFIRESQYEKHKVPFRVLTFLEFFHGGDDEALGIFDLLHDEPHVHRWKLWLALAAAIDAMLADKSQRVCQNIQSRRKAASNRAHLEFVSFFGFAIMIEHDEPPLCRRS